MTLSKFRKGKGKTQLEMSEIIGVSYSMYTKIENGVRNPSFNFIDQFKLVFPKADVNIIFFSKKSHGECGEVKKPA